MICPICSLPLKEEDDYLTCPTYFHLKPNTHYSKFNLKRTDIITNQISFVIEEVAIYPNYKIINRTYESLSLSQGAIHKYLPATQTFMLIAKFNFTLPIPNLESANNKINKYLLLQ